MLAVVTWEGALDRSQMVKSPLGPVAPEMIPRQPLFTLDGHAQSSCRR